MDVKRAFLVALVLLGVVAGVRAATAPSRHRLPCRVLKLVRRPDLPVCSEIVFTHPTRRANSWSAVVNRDDKISTFWPWLFQNLFHT
jgi:hypothetical protein